MSIAVVLPRPLQVYARGRGTVVVDRPCATVAEAMSCVADAWPAVIDRVLTEQRDVREHVNIFVGEENIRFAQGLQTRVGDGDTIMIVAAVSGG
jgi:molybdopterin converting factor small subunit